LRKNDICITAHQIWWAFFISNFGTGRIIGSKLIIGRDTVPMVRDGNAQLLLV